MLNREQFELLGFKRDGFKCIVPDCNKLVASPKSVYNVIDKSGDFHHLLERRLWTKKEELGGYYLSNGASLCEWHHRYGAETCAIQPQILRQWAGIKEVVLPSGWDKNKSYDKWGVVLKRPTRYSIKWPSTPYSHISPGYDVNDINLPDLKPFLNIPLVLTVKLDGSNAKVGRNIVAARNGSHAEHPSFDRLKADHARFGKLIPENILIFGENLVAVHSIHYKDKLTLDSFFQVFGIYDVNTMLFGGWDEVEEMAKRIGHPTVHVVERIEPISEEWRLEQKLLSHFDRVVKEGHEGLVLRQTWGFTYANFEGYESDFGIKVNAICKFVRANHISSSEHWSRQSIVRNEIHS